MREEIKTARLFLREMDRKATYEQIKDYVREQTGFQVSSLNISGRKNEEWPGRELRNDH